MAEKGAFWSTIPGILTGLAALITAVGGLVLALNQTGFLENEETNSEKSIYEQMIKSEDLTVWGEWSSWYECGPKTWARAYEMKVETFSENEDSTALDGIKLDCYDIKGNLANSITSKVQPAWGKWKKKKACSSKESFFKGFKIRVQKPQGSDIDDTAANSIIFICTNGEEVEAEGGGTKGEWLDQEVCPMGDSTRNIEAAICGVRARIEKSQGSGDDTAINNVEFKCCEVDR